MITTKEDLDTIQNISLISGVDVLEIEKVFQAFITEFTFKYTNNKQIHVPYIGRFLIRYRGEEITDEGKESQVDAFFSPHDQIKRVVGQLKDIEKTKDYTKLDTFVSLKKILKQDFKAHINDQIDN